IYIHLYRYLFLFSHFPGTHTHPFFTCFQYPGVHIFPFGGSTHTGLSQPYILACRCHIHRPGNKTYPSWGFGGIFNWDFGGTGFSSTLT
ncbi:MAG TPA: hypothetical protein PLD74_12640, partial [Prolixibacteraceae bacterium]|nr:hypothetical protein [Prolixibacteraceae bacterium]